MEGDGGAEAAPPREEMGYRGGVRERLQEGRPDGSPQLPALQARQPRSRQEGADLRQPAQPRERTGRLRDGLHLLDRRRQRSQGGGPLLGGGEARAKQRLCLQQPRRQRGVPEALCRGREALPSRPRDHARSPGSCRQHRRGDRHGRHGAAAADPRRSGGRVQRAVPQGALRAPPPPPRPEPGCRDGAEWPAGERPRGPRRAGWARWSTRPRLHGGPGIARRARFAGGPWRPRWGWWPGWPAEQPPDVCLPRLRAVGPVDGRRPGGAGDPVDV